MKRQMCFQILRNEIEIFLHFYLFFFLPSQFGDNRGLQLPSSPQREDEGPFS